MHSHKKRDNGETPGEVMLVSEEAMIEEREEKGKDGQPVEEASENASGDGAEETASGAGADNAENAEGAAESASEDVEASIAGGEGDCVEVPRAEWEKIREERDAYLDLARRERADFDNYRKRMQKEMAEMKRASLAGFLKEFFGPLDDMDRVLQESVKTHSFESIVQGAHIMQENFWRVLAKAGVRKIDAKGKQFDPSLHEAMAAVPSGGVPPNTVLEIYENGYKLDEFILRPARVVVSRAPEE